jgi:hypothetical protein
MFVVNSWASMWSPVIYVQSVHEPDICLYNVLFCSLVYLKAFLTPCCHRTVMWLTFTLCILQTRSLGQNTVNLCCVHSYCFIISVKINPLVIAWCVPMVLNIFIYCTNSTCVYCKCI